MFKIAIMGLVLGLTLASNVAYMQGERDMQIDILERVNGTIFMRIVHDDGSYLRTSFTALNAETTLAAIDARLSGMGVRSISVNETATIQALLEQQD